MLSLIIYLSIRSFEQLKERKTAENSSLRLPSNLHFQKLDNTSFSYDSLKSKGFYIIIYFNTECDYCQNEIKSLIQNSFLLENTSVLLISAESKDRIIKFKKTWNPHNNSNLIYLSDSSNLFFSLFGTNVVPSTFIYNKNKNLIHKYNGEVDFSIILKQIFYVK